MSLTHPHVRIAEGNVGRADVNAGYIIIPPMANRQITVVDAWLRAVGGAVTANTSIDLLDTTTGTIATSFAQAALTENTVVRAGASNTTATGLGTALGEDEGLKIISVGTADTVTSVDYFVYYTVTEAKR